MSRERVYRDFTGGPLCLSGWGATKVLGLGEKKTAAVDHMDLDFREGAFVSVAGESGKADEAILHPRAACIKRLISDVPKIREEWDLSAEDFKSE